MSALSRTQAITMLQACRAAAPHPWFPLEFAAELGIPTQQLSHWLGELERRGWIELHVTDNRRGPGYRLTKDGVAAIESPAAVSNDPSSTTDSDDRPYPADPRNPLSQLSSTRRPYATWILALVQGTLFLMAARIALAGRWENLRGFLLAGDAPAQFATGAVDAAAVEDNQWWRFLTTNFVHHDFFHLFINVSTFLGYGRQLEPIWGSGRFALIYLLSGVFAVGFALLIDPSGQVLGSSACISGILLASTLWFLLNSSRLPRPVVGRGIRQSLLAFAWLIGWWALLSWLGGTRFSWAFFLGGAVGGTLVAVPMFLNQRTAGSTRWAYLWLSALVPLMGVGLAVQAKQHHPGWADAVAKSRATRERFARQVEQRRHQAEQADEVDRFNEILMPAILKGDRFFEKQWRDIEELAKQPPAARNRGLVQEALGQLRQAQQDVSSGLTALRQAPAFTNDRVANASRAARVFLEDLRDLLGATQNCLGEGTPWDARLNEHLEQTERSSRNFNRSLKAR